MNNGGWEVLIKRNYILKFTDSEYVEKENFVIFEVYVVRYFSIFKHYQRAGEIVFVLYFLII